MAEGHETCRREIASLKDLVSELAKRLNALEKRTSPEQEDPVDGKYELYVMDSPTRAQREEAKARIHLPPSSPLNRSQSAGTNQGGTGTSQRISCVSFSSAFHRHDNNSISMINAGAIRSYSQGGDSSVENSEAERDSPPGTPGKSLRIDTSPRMHLSRTASISPRVTIHKETEHLDSEDEKEEHRVRASSRPSAVGTNPSCSFSHSNSMPKQRSLSLFRSSGPVNYTRGPVGPTCFDEYITEYVNTGPDPAALKSNVIECARTDKEAYEELKEVRAKLISRLGLHAKRGQENSQAWLERFLFAAGLDDPKSRNELLLQFSQDFILQATTRARVILEEVHVPQHNKTIKPLKVGGVAGGTKFLDHDILFKFADDPKIGGSKHLYGGTEADHERAAKAAANDLKGADAYFRCFALLGRIPVVVPPQVVMDFNGFRLIAMPWLPLRDATLSYGSGDGGKTVHDEDDIMRAALKFAAHHLHLARHFVKGKVLDCAGDVEAHVGKDERRYLVDLARTFPPEDPHATHLEYDPAVVFYRLHRTEFMEHLKSLQDRERFPSISPDAFSKWGDKQDSLSHNKNATAAMRYLLSQRIPALVNFLKNQNEMTQNLGQVMQSWGISVRHMGLVRLKAREVCCKTSLIQQLLVNMVARCCKNLLRRNLREANNKNVDDSLALFLNSLTQASPMLWDVQLPFDLTRRFGSAALTSDECKTLHTLCQPSLGFILKYLLAQTGVTLKASWRPGFRFLRDSFLPISVRSKTFSALEALLQEDNIKQACKAPTRDSFFCLVTKLSRKASEDLAFLLSIIDDPEELLRYFQNRAGKKGQNVGLLIMCALGLFFSDIDIDKEYPKQIQLQIEHSPDAVVLDLVPQLPQIFSDAQRQSLMTSKLQALCDSERLQDGARELAQSLLAAQANPNAQSLESRDPLLHTCVTRGHKPVAEALFEAKASVHHTDAFHHSLEQIVFAYSTEPTRFAEMLCLKPPQHPLFHSIRLRVHLLLSDKPTSLNVLQKLTLTIKMKSPKMMKSGNSAIHRMQVGNSSKEIQTNHFPVNMEATFPEWPPNDTLKCTLTCGNNNRVAEVYIPRQAEGFTTILLTMVHKGNYPHFVLKGDMFVASSAKPPPPPPPKSPTPKLSGISKMGSSSNLKSLYSSPPSFVSKFTKSRRHSLETDPIKVVILGISESGKSALDKRLCGNLSKEEIPRYVNIIRCNAIAGVQTLIMGSRAKLHQFLPTNHRSITYVTNLAVVFDLKPDDLAELLPHLKAVLSDPGIQRTRLDPTVFQMSDAVDRNPWHVNDTADHFLNKLDEIFDKNYVPSNLDCFACRTRSQGVVEHKVFTGPGPGGAWRLCKGGGAAAQRKKWDMIYDGTDGLIFTVSLVGYDRVSEDARTNRMQESLTVWESVVGNESLRGASFVLLFTFDDKFKQMLASHEPLKDTKSAFAGFFAGHPSYKEACDYLTHTFVTKAKITQLKVVFVDLLNDESYHAAYKEIQLFFSQRCAKGLLVEY